MKRKFFCVFFALVMSLSLCACGAKQSGVPGSSGQGGFDTVFSGPTEWDSTSEPTEPDTSDGSTAEPGPDGTDGLAQTVPDDGGEEQEPVAGGTEEPDEMQEEDGERTIPPLTELVGLSSADATERMGRFLRGEVIAAWGNPTVDVSMDGAGHDAWSLSYQDGRDTRSLEIHVRYDYKDGVAKVCECYSRYQGWEDAIWPDMPGGSFTMFVAGQKDMVKVLQRSEGLTRHDYMGLLSDPRGFCLDLDDNYVGDVFYVSGEQHADESYILVEYDDTYCAYPASIRYYSCRDGSGRWSTYPVGLPEDMKYVEGVYNVANAKPK